MKHMYEIREAYRDALDQLTVDPETGELTGTEALEALEGDIEDKIEAMKCYGSQLKEFPNPRSEKAIRSLSEFRGSTICVRNAEAFMTIREIL